MKISASIHLSVLVAFTLAHVSEGKQKTKVNTKVIGTPIKNNIAAQEDLGNKHKLVYDFNRKSKQGFMGEWRLVPGKLEKNMKVIKHKKLKEPVWQPRQCITNMTEWHEKDKLVTSLFRGEYEEERHITDRYSICQSKKMKCGRKIFDGLFSEAQLAAAEALEPHDLSSWSGIETLRETMEETFSVSNSLLNLYSAYHHTLASSGTTCMMHDDIVSSECKCYHFVAIMYLVDQKPGKCGRCETVFADEVNATGDMLSGISLQPRRGRVVFFSGGAENMHCRVEGHSGERRIMQFRFQCGSHGKKMPGLSIEDPRDKARKAGRAVDL